MRPASLRTALLRVAGLAPGGFIAGYVAGRALGRVLGGCALMGPCDEAAPLLLAVPVSVVGMGAGVTVAAARVARWWEGVAVWAAGIAATLVAVSAIGLLGPQRPLGRIVALVWLGVAVTLAVPVWRRRGAGEDQEQLER